MTPADRAVGQQQDLAPGPHVPEGQPAEVGDRGVVADRHFPVGDEDGHVLQKVV
jgi:hypothetical protein